MEVVEKEVWEILPEEKWSLQLVVRQFVQIPIEKELRGFMYNRKLSALSQVQGELR